MYSPVAFLQPEGTMTTADHQQYEPYGWSARIDLYDCDTSKLKSSKVIEDFVESLCGEILKMKRHGSLLIDRFGDPDDKTGGFSFVQLIETSSVVGHVSDSKRSLYLDIFSCREFDAAMAAGHAAAHFGARNRSESVDERR